MDQSSSSNHHHKEPVISLANIDMEEFRAWQNDQITKSFMQEIRRLLSSKEKETVSFGALDFDNPYKTQSQLAKSQGYCEAISDVLKLEPNRNG